MAASPVEGYTWSQGWFPREGEEVLRPVVEVVHTSFAVEVRQVQLEVASSLYHTFDHGPLGDCRVSMALRVVP